MRAATGAMVATSSGLAMIGLVLPLGMQEQKPGSGIDQRLSGHKYAGLYNRGCKGKWDC